MGESMQRWVGRNRPPRVQITYDVETGGAIEKRELPFVVGIFADLSGDRLDEDSFPEFASRMMESVDRDNFNDVLAKATPSVQLGKVALKLPSADPQITTLSGSITFRSLDDFSPVAVVKAIPELNALYRTRGHIRMLQSKAESSTGLTKALEPLMDLDEAGRMARTPFKVLTTDRKELQAFLTLYGIVQDLANEPDKTKQTKLATDLGFTNLEKALTLVGSSDRKVLRTSLQKLFIFAHNLANESDKTEQTKLATALGFSTLDAARTFVGRFAATNTSANLTLAATQVAALALLGDLAATPDHAAKAIQAKIVDALAIEDAKKGEFATSAKTLQTALKAATAAGAEASLPEDIALAALLYLGIQEPGPDDSKVLKTSLQKLFTFAHKLANQPSKAEKTTLATALGFRTLDAARAFIGLFAATNTPDNRRIAADQVTALASLGDTAAQPDDAARAIQAKIVDALAIEDAKKGEFATRAKSLQTALNANPADGAEPSHQDDIVLAALLYPGVQESEINANIAKVDKATGVQISPRLVIEQKHLADSRWYANKLLMNGFSVPAEVSEIESVLKVFDSASLQTHLDRRNFLPQFGTFVREILNPLDMQSAAVRKWMPTVLVIDKRVDEIDQLISSQLREIMHAPNFQKVEATWRGLHYLISRADTGKMLKLYIFNATQHELLDDMERAVDKDQSHIFKMIYESAYGTLGGEPYSLLIGGYEVGRDAQDIEFLTKISEVAAAAHAPYITAASPSIFGFQSYADLARPRDLEKIFEGTQLFNFQAFRHSEDSRYVALVMPHFLLRLPYGAKSWPVDGLAFEEKSEASEPSDFLWGNAAYLLAERITHAYSLYSWTAAIRGVEGGGLVEGLPLYTYPVYPNNAEAQQLFCPTEVSITDRREKELNDLGFIALCHHLGSGNAVFFGGQTANLPKTYISDAANANAKLSAMLPYMLAASRFAHYIKVIMRDKVGAFMTKGNVETFLNTWISQYVLLDENARQEAKASYPLSQAHVTVTDVPGEPGSYNAVVFLRPHFQLEELTTSIRLVASLPT
jgi:type VI secretion system ImpC/EvpB family protein/type VI secretion system ImpB/VipA family protein